MSLRCSCPDDEHSHVNGGWRDPYVFGPCVTCSGEKPARQTTLPKLVPSSWFVVPAQYDGDPSDWTELRPYETTLSDGDGDLG